jgi:hypothetical protein
LFPFCTKSERLTIVRNQESECLGDFVGIGKQDAVNVLMRADIDGRMHPNPLTMSLTDARLFRYGRLDAALGEASARYRKWRDLWKQIAANPDAFWDQTVRIVRKNARRPG